MSTDLALAGAGAAFIAELKRIVAANDYRLRPMHPPGATVIKEFRVLVPAGAAKFEDDAAAVAFLESIDRELDATAQFFDLKPCGGKSVRLSK